VVDSTNASPAYQRNRLRIEALPALERAFPGWGRGIDALARKSALIAGFLRTSLATRFSWVEPRRGSWWIEARAASFFALEPALRLEALYAGAERLGAGRVPFAMLEAACRQGAESIRGRIAASSDFAIERRGEKL